MNYEDQTISPYMRIKSEISIGQETNSTKRDDLIDELASLRKQ